MSDTETGNVATGLLMLSLGHAIIQWAQTELHLSLLFRTLFDEDPEIADLFWSRVRSFEAKLELMHDLAKVRLKGDRLRDWILLRTHTLALYGKRNRLAHSTQITHAGRPALEPFSTVSKPVTLVLFKEDVDNYAKEFMELTGALMNFNVAQMALQNQQSPEPESDLLRRLRSADDRKREALRHRDLAWRQYLDRNTDLKFD